MLLPSTTPVKADCAVVFRRRYLIIQVVAIAQNPIRDQQQHVGHKYGETVDHMCLIT